MKRFPLILICAAVAAALLTPASAQHGGSDKAPVPKTPPPSAEAKRLKLAVVNDEAITLADLQDSFGQRHSGHGGLLAGEEIIREIVNKAVEEKLLVQEGRRMGIPDEPAFKQEILVFKDLRMLDALEASAIDKASEPTPAEVKAVYDLLPRQLHVLMLETRDRGKADQALGRVRIGEDFESVTRQVSTHRSRTRGGDLGWITWGTLDPVTEAVVLKTPVGQVAGPIAAEGGYRVVKVLEEKTGTPPPLGKVQEQIRAILASRAKGSKRADLLASIRKLHPPVEDAAAVAVLLAPAGDPKAAPAPADDAVLLRTATGLTVNAGYVRGRAAESKLNLAAAWESARDDALLIDEARRRFGNDPEILRQVELHEEQQIRTEVEGTAVLKDLKVEEAEVKPFYDRNPGAFSSPATYHMRHIVVASKEAADEVRRRLAAGADFAALAKEKSIDAETAGAGGELGWNPGPIQAAGPSVEEGVLALKEGEISEPLHTKQGWAVVQMVEKRPGQPRPFESVKAEVAKRMIITRQRELREAFVAKLRAVSTISLDQKAIARAVKIQDDVTAGRLTPAPAPSPQPKI